MLIPERLRNENIAEYIIYMYMMEDVIRAFQFDEDRLIDDYFKPQLPDESFLGLYRDWLHGIIMEMKKEKIEKQGHLFQVREMINEFSYLHNLLHDVLKEQKYIDLYNQTLPVIKDFASRSNMNERSIVEVAFHSQYMKLLMKLKKDAISAETEAAFDQMRIFVAYLSERFQKMRQEN